jgi:hypothetical protein
VYVYERDRNGIWSQVLRLQPSDLPEEAGFGWSVAIDDNVMVVGARGGSMLVFCRDDTPWTQEARLAPGDPAAETFGWSVSVKGTSIVVGDPMYRDCNKGAVFVYDFNPLSTTWNPVGVPLINSDCDQNFDHYVQLTDDGGLLATCEWYNSDVGPVYYYEKSVEGGEYVFQQGLKFENDFRSLAVDGNAMVVSEWRSGRSNVIHFFVCENGDWREVRTLDEPIFDQYFGQEVALSGNRVLITSRNNVYFNP